MKKLLRNILVILLCAAPVLGSEDRPLPDDGIELAVYLAATRHPSVSSQLAEIDALGFELDSAETQRLPALALQVAATDKLSGPTPTNGDKVYNMTAVVRQPIWVGGRIDGHIDKAAVTLELGRLSLLETQRQLMESTAITYSRVLGNRKQLEAAQRNVEEHNRLKELILRRQEGGIASLADVQLATSRLSQALSQQLQLEAELLRAINDLSSFTQQEIPALQPVSEEYIQLPPPETILPRVETVSAELQQRELQTQLARNQVELARAELLPSIYAKLEQDLYNYANDEELSRGTRVGLVVEGTVDGLGMSDLSRVRSSNARVRVAEKNVADARNELHRKIKALLSDLRSLQLVEESNQLLVSSSEQTLESFMRQYDAGRKSWVDVLNAQREASQARIGLVQTHSSLLETRLRLAVQLGQLDPLMETLPAIELTSR